MFEDVQICPYTGLRSFTEEESIYFKGREEHINHATEQLHRNKFLMLTGASGDGKSSLVYAGIVPNARAGFLKSKYTQWCVSDFRPERTPFKNLCRALARQLDIANPHIVEAELQHGFSALVDLYKNSKRFIDTHSVAWQQSNDGGRAALKREAANLIIIVDQFEEFFTNPENYHRGVPSRDSNLVLNLLLETARISLEEDLPIYVVFTMRSDYIGQCAAFRTLPEYIGFSQFFVPRLNRSQLQQVIEEPAVLNGNRISRRLTERLIQDIAEGVDQLPILQHALNQIWHAANKGSDEMDLLHYAMVGGMPADQLPDEQEKPFAKWFDHLPEKIKACYHEPNLQNVLDVHANKLYESAAESFKSRTGKTISDDIAKEIIKVTFTCLTKIDQSRAVRNRMTLKEIERIINRSEVNCETLGGVLNVFREPGNTFIRPFVTEEIESGALREDDVLDITHESLIRNWELLDQWAKEEYNNYAISLDFEQQLNLWVNHHKSSDFLLSMGPLNYFETWYNKINPNASWIARYLPEEIDEEKKIDNATVILNNSREFLKRSARKHLITRTVVKYGPRRVAVVLVIIAAVVLSSFGIKEYFEQQNSSVLRKIKNESITLAGDRKVAQEDKSILLCENIRLGLTSIPEIAKGINDRIERINAISGIATILIMQGWHQPEKEIYQSLTTVDSLLQREAIAIETPNYDRILEQSMDFMTTLGLAYALNPNERMKNLVQQNAQRMASWVKLIAKNKPEGFNGIKNFETALEQAINRNAFNQEEIAQLITALSPLEKSAGPWVKTKFARDILSERGRFNYSFSYNGLYQELAYLYAASGRYQKAIQCTDTLLKYNQNYHERTYANMPDNAKHIAAVFYKYGHHESLDGFVKGYCSNTGLTEVEFYRALTAGLRFSIDVNFNMHLFSFEKSYTNLILMFSDLQQQDYFYKKYRLAIAASKLPPEEKNFYNALLYKDKAVSKGMMLGIQGIKNYQELIYPWFDSAFYYYKFVSPSFLSQKVSMFNNTESRALKYLFVYPDFVSSVYPTEPRGGYFYYSSTDFLNYILNKKLFEYVFPSDEELAFIDDWLGDFRSTSFLNTFSLRIPIDRVTLSRLVQKINQRQNSKLDFSELHLLLANQFMEEGKTDSARLWYSHVTPSKILNITASNGILYDRYGMHQTALAVSNLAQMNERNEACRFVQVYKKPVNRSSLYSFAARYLISNKIKSDAVNWLIDSARAEMLRVEKGVDQQSRLLLPYALAMRLDKNDLNESEQVIRNVSFKNGARAYISRSLGFHKQLYNALENIPENVAATDRAVFLWNNLYGYSQGLDRDPGLWKDYDQRHRFWYIRNLGYDDENN